MVLDGGSMGPELSVCNTLAGLAGTMGPEFWISGLKFATIHALHDLCAFAEADHLPLPRERDCFMSYRRAARRTTQFTGSLSRRLGLELLEDRTLLSASAGLDDNLFADDGTSNGVDSKADPPDDVQTSNLFNRVMSISLHDGFVRENAGLGAIKGTVTRETDVLNESLTVSLSSDDESEAVVAEFVVIPAGETSASFLIDIVDDDILDHNQLVTITATSDKFGDPGSASAILEVIDVELLTVELETYVIHEDMAGTVITATVTRHNTDIDQPQVVNIGTDNSPSVSVQSSVTIAAFEASATFPITITHDAAASGPVTVGFSMQTAHHSSEKETLAILEVDIDDLPQRSLESLNYTVFNGAQNDDQSGDYVRTVGDMNGDGYDDFLIAAVNANRIDPSFADNGELYVVFGTPNGYPPVVELADLDGSDGFTITGHLPDGELGYEVSNGGDVNGDGFSDIIVAASDVDLDLVEGGIPPHVFVIFGKGTPFDASVDLQGLDGTNGFAIIAHPDDFGDLAGDSVDIAGDINGDGFNDIVIGAPYASSATLGIDDGAAMVVFGKAGGFDPVFDLGTLDGSNGFIFYGDLNHRDFADDVKFAGDINDDGYGDILVGSDNNINFPAETFVVFGKAAGFSATLAASQIDGTNGFIFSGAASGHQVGEEVTNLGDINGDGIPDMMVWESTSNQGVGQAHVLFGRAGDYSKVVSVESLDGSNGFTITGIQAIDRFGEKLSFAEDINGDGIDDFLMGAWYANLPDAERVGAVYVLFGTQSGFAAEINVGNLTPDQGFVIYGETPGDFFGSAVSAAGDVNGDGIGDFLVGAQGADPNGIDSAGRTYLIYGEDFTGTLTHGGDEADNLLTGGDTADFMVGGNGNDTLVGVGGSDTISGGAGNDVFTVRDLSFQSLDGGSGFDSVRFSGSSQPSNPPSFQSNATNSDWDLTALPNRKFLGIDLIDISGNGANVLTLNQLVVLNLSGTSNTLYVRADTVDTVNFGGGWTFDGLENFQGQDYSVYSQGAAILKIHVAPYELSFQDNSGAGGDAAIQFSTSVTQPGQSSSQSYYVRPALPDDTKTVLFTNVGTHPLTIYEIIVNAPHTTSDVVLTSDAGDDIVLAVGETLTIHLTYTPTSPGSQSDGFSMANGLVIHTDSANIPTLEVALGGAPTFNSDLNYDGNVNFADLGLLNLTFGLREGDPGYSASFDINGDGAINFGDLGPLNVEFGLSLSNLAQQSQTTSLQPPAAGAVATQELQSSTESALFSNEFKVVAEDIAKRMVQPVPSKPVEAAVPTGIASDMHLAVFEELGGGTSAAEELFDFGAELWDELELALTLL